MSDRAQKAQLHRDQKHLELRLDMLEREIETEPDELVGIYHVLRRRFTRVGLVYLYPDKRL